MGFPLKHSSRDDASPHWQPGTWRWRWWRRLNAKPLDVRLALSIRVCFVDGVLLLLNEVPNDGLFSHPRHGLLVSAGAQERGHLGVVELGYVNISLRAVQWHRLTCESSISFCVGPSLSVTEPSLLLLLLTLSSRPGPSSCLENCRLR